MKNIALILIYGILILGCQSKQKTAENNSKKIRILIDTDTNNELDDQHALAYAFLNSEVFDLVGITVN